MDRLKRFLSNSNGMTLVEVIVTVIIFSIVMSAIFSFMGFGVDSFGYGINQNKERAELRLAMYRLTDEVRNSFLVDVVADESSVTADRLFVVVEGNQLLLKEKDVSDVVTTVSKLSSDVVDSISFQIISEPPITVGYPNKYTLTVNLIGDTITIDSDILLNNIQDVDISAVGTDVILEYSSVIN